MDSDVAIYIDARERRASLVWPLVCVLSTTALAFIYLFIYLFRPRMQVMIWDDHVNRCIGELMFKSEVRAVKLRRDRVIVVLLQKVYVYRYVYVCMCMYMWGT
jgi:hypothetical protein